MVKTIDIFKKGQALLKDKSEIGNALQAIEARCGEDSLPYRLLYAAYIQKEDELQRYNEMIWEEVANV